MTETDWRALLVKYMTRILNEEGISYIHEGMLSEPLTPEETALLEAVEREAQERMR